MAEEQAEKRQEESKRVHTYPLIRVIYFIFISFSNIFIQNFWFQNSDMNEEMRTEAMELCVTACEKFASNNEVSYLKMRKFLF